MRREQARAQAAAAKARGDTVWSLRLEQEAELHDKAATYQDAAVSKFTDAAVEFTEALSDAVREAARVCREPRGSLGSWRRMLAVFVGRARLEAGGLAVEILATLRTPHRPGDRSYHLG